MVTKKNPYSLFKESVKDFLFTSDWFPHTFINFMWSDFSEIEVIILLIISECENIQMLL